jgi:predicted GNAT superfamily acetyltransferase
VTRTLGTGSLASALGAERACARALEVARGAGVEVAELGELREMTDVSVLFDDLWGTPGNSYLSPSLIRALSFAGNYAAAAFGSGGELVGAVLGFLGSDGEGTHLHSHILGVSTSSRGSNVGFALKQHQRAWALHNGLHRITWTFDPLVRRNAFFNLQKLGAGAASYLVNFYGDMDDDINAGDESDRLLIEWHLENARVLQAAEDRVDEPDVSAASVALSMDGETSSVTGDVVVCATPDDIVALRRSDPQRAVHWRRALRDTLGEAMTGGYRVTGFARSGWYVLERT